MDVRGGNRNKLDKAALQVNDARFTKVKGPRFSGKASGAPPKKSDPGTKQVKQKMSARKIDQGGKKGTSGGGGGGGGMMEQDSGYLTA